MKHYTRIMCSYFILEHKILVLVWFSFIMTERTVIRVLSSLSLRESTGSSFFPHVIVDSFSYLEKLADCTAVMGEKSWLLNCYSRQP